MNEKQGMALLVLMATMFAQIEHEESTRKIDKIRKQIRQGMKAYYYKVGKQRYTAIAEFANEAWETAKQQVSPEEFAVSLSLAMSIVYSLLEEPYKTLWFSEKNFDKALGSLEYGFELTPEVEEASQWLITIFEKGLKLNTKPSRFADFVKTLKDK